METTNIGKIFQLALKDTGMKQVTLSEKIDMSPGQLGQLFHAKSASTNSVFRIAQGLGLKPSELLAYGETNET